MSSPYQNPAAQSPHAYRTAESKGLSVTSLVLGILSVVAGWTFVVPIVGGVLGIVALRREPTSKAIAVWGIVLNAVMLLGTLVLGLIGAVVGLALLPFHFFW